MNYLDLLKTSASNSVLKQQVSHFEKTHDINIPRLFKSLITTYDLSCIGTEKILSYYDKIHDAKLQLYDVKNSLDDNISIVHWFSLDEISDAIKRLYQEEDQYILKDYLPFCESFDQGILLLGISEFNLDEIFIESTFNEPRIKKTNNNIFDFLHSFEIKPMESYLPEGFKLDNLYKNWGEDFWRIRDETS